jgi:hypothetical protein
VAGDNGFVCFPSAKSGIVLTSGVRVVRIGDIQVGIVPAIHDELVPRGYEEVAFSGGSQFVVLTDVCAICSQVEILKKHCIICVG